MLKHRVIPSLLLKNGGLYKTTKFKNPMYVGDPINAIKIFNEKEVDELIIMDISASKEGNEPDYRIIEQFASECFMPLCYGGGIHTLEQARKIFSLGIEKVSLQTGIIDSRQLITDIALIYGNQSVVVSIDVKKSLLGKFQFYSSCSGKSLNIDIIQFIEESINAGAGEILINSVDRDGSMSGVDLELIKKVSSECSVPLIAMGGVGSLEDIKLAIASGADAIAAGAYFIYHGPHRAVLISYPKYDDLVKLLGG